MSYSVIKKEGQEHTPRHLFTAFSEEEWNAYPFAGEEKLKWFRDAKLGLFFHVGISALGKVDIGWSRHTHKLPDPGEGKIPDDVYDGWAEQIRMEAFDAEEWISLAKENGFRYVVIITKHHDGFHMWDTAYSDYKITNAPMGRDYLGELIAACHTLQMPVGLYYSQRDWHHPDYAPIDPALADRIPDVPFYRMKDGGAPKAGKTHADYIRYMHSAVRELMQKYGKIDILWWDSACYNYMFTKEMWDSYTVEREVRALQPHILINNRASVPGDFDTPECHVGFLQRERAWETCAPLGGGWAWTGDGCRPFRAILHEMVQSVCGDGNYLLSIGAMPSGEISPEDRAGLGQLGAWMRKYGESLYGTRSGPWNPGALGGSVYKNSTVYLHLLNRPEGNVLRLPLGNYRIGEVSCMTSEKPTIQADNGCLIITFPEGDFDDMIVKLRMTEPIGEIGDGLAVIG